MQPSLPATHVLSPISMSVYRRIAQEFALELAAEHTTGEAAELEILAEDAILALAGEGVGARLSFAREVAACLRRRALRLRNL